MKKLRIVVVLLAALMMAACTTSQLLNALNAVGLATSVGSTAVSALCAAAVIPAPVCVPAETYLSALNTWISSTATELKSSDTDAQKVSAIWDSATAIVVPNLPAGTDPRVATYLVAADSAQRAFLTVLGPKSQLQLSRLGSQNTKASFLERRTLTQISDRATAAKALLTVTK